MNPSAGPFRLIVGVVGAWCCARAAVLIWPFWASTAVDSHAALASLPAIPAGLLPRAGASDLPLERQAPVRLALATHSKAALRQPQIEPERKAPASAPVTAAAGEPDRATPVDEGAGGALASFAPASVALPLTSSEPDRLNGSAWLFVRGRGQGSLANGGQLGGSQAGARVAYRLTGETGPRIDVAARASRALQGAQDAEAAIGVDLRPSRDFPLRLTVERRVAIERGGRNAWSAYLAGGFEADRLPGGLRADGYAQAGVVGFERRDGFADGALRLEHPFNLGRTARAGIGAGVWGAVQPGVSRLDIGPRARVSVGLGGATATVALEGRFRVAGRARPGNGVALTTAIDF